MLSHQVSSVTLASGRLYKFEHNNCSHLSTVIMPNGARHALRTNIRRLLRDEVYQSPTSKSFTWISTFGLDGELVATSFPTNTSVASVTDESMRPFSISFGSEEVRFTYHGNTAQVARATRFLDKNKDSEIILVHNGGLVTNLDMLYEANNLEPEVKLEYGHNNDFLTTKVSGEIFGKPVSIPVSYSGRGEPSSYGLFKYSHPTKRQFKHTHGSMECSLTYSTTALLQSKECHFNSKKVYSLNVIRDATNRIVRKNIQVGEKVTGFEYSYDIDGQLIQTKKEGNIKEAYTYDQNGNRVQWTSPTASGSKVNTAEYGNDDQLKFVQSSGIKDRYTYDLNGFLKNRGPQTLHYNLRGELAVVEMSGKKVRYRYDAFGRRIEMKTFEGSTLIRDVKYVYSDSFGSAKPSHIVLNEAIVYTLYYDRHGHLAAMGTPSEMYYVMTDMVGTPVAVYGSFGVLDMEVRTKDSS